MLSEIDFNETAYAISEKFNFNFLNITSTVALSVKNIFCLAFTDIYGRSDILHCIHKNFNFLVNIGVWDTTS